MFQKSGLVQMKVTLFFAAKRQKTSFEPGRDFERKPASRYGKSEAK
jgi:hypothetical protein